MKVIKKIDIIGRGNVATHLYRALGNYDVTLINPHTLDGLDRNADIILISVTDRAIKEVSDKIGDTSAIVAHTSGTTPIQVLSKPGQKYGVFYPLQTFSKEVDIDYTRIPFFIEGADEETEKVLKQVAAQVSQTVYTADSEKRKIIHMASVFACNFINHLLGISNEILSKNSIPFSVLAPLINETIKKAVNTDNPHSVQTGPAVRGDEKIISSHMDMLEGHPDYQKLYMMLSDSIKQTRDKLKKRN